MSVVALSRIDHDGVTYEAGKTIHNISEEEAQILVDSKVALAVDGQAPEPAPAPADEAAPVEAAPVEPEPEVVTEPQKIEVKKA